MDDEQEKPERKKLLPALLAGFLALASVILVLYFIFQGKSSPKFFIAAVSTVSVSVGNVLPIASGATINGGNDITLTENTTTQLTVTGSVSDNNSCKDLASVVVVVYKNGTTCASAGDANNNNCYVWVDSNPSNDASCTGDSDTTYSVSHNFNLQYYATAGTWNSAILPSDSVGAGTTSTSSSVALNALQSLDVSALTYGSVAPGSNSTGDHTAVVTNTGNTSINFKVSGTDLTCSSIGSIPVASQQYKLSSFSYGSGTALSGTATDVTASLSAPTSSTAPVTQNTYWQISIPNGTKGTCSGTTTFTAEPAS
jgi:hypothetical protein